MVFDIFAKVSKKNYFKVEENFKQTCVKYKYLTTLYATNAKIAIPKQFPFKTKSREPLAQKLEPMW